MSEQEENASDQLKHEPQGGKGLYPESSTNADKPRRSHGKGARTDSFEVDPAELVALTPQQHAAAVQALTELLTQYLHHTNGR
ncbi:hypothetical protein [Nocardiopsis synnemataformans]|uniref:hypothetical protein n=1 Tax=Nocardiopsis synnemataformans TaxID=61305 RepID=UPI003EBE5AF2